MSPAHAARPSRAREDAFRVEPYSAKELRFHITGAALNAAVVVASLAWVTATWERHAIPWWGAALALLAGAYLADLVSGLLHWAFDTWFDESIPFVRRMVLQVREHHIYPQRIFDIHFTHDAGTLSMLSGESEANSKPRTPAATWLYIASRNCSKSQSSGCEASRPN